jgi:membrane-associated phospholipid phosphatase
MFVYGFTGVKGRDSNRVFIKSFKQIGFSAKNAILDPYTIGALTLATGIYLSHKDQQISDWATAHHPVFGSEQNARTTTDLLQYSSLAIYGITAIIKNNMNGNSTISFPIVNVSSDISAIFLTVFTTEILKNNVGRLRPNHGDERSFPSGHTSFTTINANLTSHQLNTLEMKNNTRFLCNAALATMVTATAWGRIEGKKHYPTDVLAGAALGNFVGNFITSLYNDNIQNKTSSINMQISPDDCQIFVAMKF